MAALGHVDLRIGRACFAIQARGAGVRFRAGLFAVVAANAQTPSSIKQHVSRFHPGLPIRNEMIEADSPLDSIALIDFMRSMERLSTRLAPGCRGHPR